MEIQTLSNEELLTLLISEKTAATIYHGRLAPLVFGSDDQAPHRRLVASLEFTKRLMREELYLGPALTSPAAVSEYLTAHFLGREYEAFVVIFLDTRHRVLFIEEMFRGSIDGANGVSTGSRLCCSKGTRQQRASLRTIIPLGLLSQVWQTRRSQGD